MHRLAFTAATTAALAAAGTASAATFTLRASSSERLDPDAPSFSVTSESIVANLQVTGASGTFNSTSSGGFGIDTTGSGDETSFLDAGLGAESFTISFNQPVFFDSISISSVATDGSEGLNVQLPQQSNSIFVSSTGVTSFSGNTLVDVGQTVSIAYVAGTGNGISFNGFAATANPSAVPEPFAAGAAGLLAAIALRRRQAPRI